MNQTDLWDLVQADILGFLQADIILAALPGVLVEPGSSEDQLHAKVAAALGAGTDGKVGDGYLVLPIEEATDENANLPQGPFKLPITIQFVQNVVLSRGPRGRKIPLRIYAGRAAKALKLYTPVLLTQSLVPVNPVIHQFTPDRDANLRVGQVNFRASEADGVIIFKPSRPQISPSSGAAPQTVTLTCAGATEIYYTLDGSHPSAASLPPNGSATLYTAPFSVNLPALLRVRGFSAGAEDIGSDTAAVQYS